MVLIAAALLTAAANVSAQTMGATQVEGLTRVEANPKAGFSYPYYVYLPERLRAGAGARSTLLVIPNNTGKIDDDIAVHDASALREISHRGKKLADDLAVPVLEPVFPRPKSEWRVYTHALDRDSLVTDKPELKRFDLQLIHMIDDARKRMKAQHLELGPRVLMCGFSASGMFTNRFAMLHPDRIAAAAFGSPGGWAMAPVPQWKGKSLRYPIGTADMKELTGRKFDAKAVRKTPMFLFMGEDDKNDSVVYRDSYDTEDKELIFELFGKALMERWPVTLQMYTTAAPSATLKLYPGVAHEVTDAMWSDIEAFFRTNLPR